MLKTGREEIVGLLSAIAEDMEQCIQWGEKEVEKLVQFAQQSSIFHIEISHPNEAGQPIPRAEITPKIPFERQDLVDALKNHTPSIYTALKEVNFLLILHVYMKVK